MNPPGRIFDEELIVARRTRPGAASADFITPLAAEEIAARLDTIARDFRHTAICAPAGGKSARALADRPRLGIVKRLCSPMELAATGQSFDCVICLPGLETLNDLPGALALINAALAPDGLFMAALVGGDTLCELRRAWTEAESDLRGGVSPRVAPMCHVRDAGDLLQRAGFALPVADADRFTVRYSSPLALMRELKLAGAANALAGRARSLTSPSLLASACAHYEGIAGDGDGRVRATCEIIYLTAWSPHPDQPQPLKPGSARARLADALGAVERKLR